jgi:rod shape-determining protein MreC
VSLRDSPLGELKVPLTWTAAVALIVAAVVAIAVLVSDRREALQAEAYGATRGVADQILTPVGDALSAPGRWTGAGIDTVRGYFFAVSENRRLKAQLKEMDQWRAVAFALRNENNRFRTLLGLKTDPPIPMVAARVVTDSRGPFAETRLANAGREKGVKVGNPVMSENGLVGLIIGVTNGASRVLLLTDTASKVPVMIDRTNARAILTGDGGPNPKLAYLRGMDPVKQGDRVMTSGDGGLLPRGLPVGTAVKGLDGRWRVVLASDRTAIDFVRILLFQDFAQLANQKELAERSVPPPTAGGPAFNLPPGQAAAAAAAAKPAPAPVAAAPPKPKAPAVEARPSAAHAATGAEKPAPAAKPAEKPATAKKAASAKPAAARPAAARPEHAGPQHSTAEHSGQEHSGKPHSGPAPKPPVINEEPPI